MSERSGRRRDGAEPPEGGAGSGGDARGARGQRSSTQSTPSRGKARKRAVDVLYEAELRGLPRVEVLAERLAAADPPINEYTVELIEGVDAHIERLDELLARYAVGWTLERMPPVDRCVLRLGAYELLYADRVPDAVAISEAVRLAKELSTEESPSFVNGLLSSLLKLKPTLSA